MKRNFAGIADRYCDKATAEVWLQSIPYGGTCTWGKGTDKAFVPFLDALEQVELYDLETRTEPYRKGVHILPEIRENRSPEAVFKAVYSTTKQLISSGKWLTFFGGEHAVSIGIIKAFYEKYDPLTVVQLDAHTDLRPHYNGSAYNHACALHDASRHTRLIQVGIRSMDSSELPFFNPQYAYLAKDIQEGTDWMEDALSKMTDKVYITIDVDVFDPSIMPATGTPEPGGLQWYPTLQYLRKIIAAKDVVGFDIVELAPIEGLRHPNFLVAKLYYTLLSYQLNKKR